MVPKLEMESWMAWVSILCPPSVPFSYDLDSTVTKISEACLSLEAPVPGSPLRQRLLTCS